MDEEDRELLKDLVEELVRNKSDVAGWSRIDRALALIDESLRTGTEDWRPARDELFKLSSARVSQGLRDSLDGQRREPASQQTRELVNRLLHRIGLPPGETRRADDPA
jgi:hypothetical protein